MGAQAHGDSFLSLETRQSADEMKKRGQNVAQGFELYYSEVDR